MKELKACDPREVDLVFYHSPCLDGFTAAWVVWNSRKEKCKYIGMSYNKKDIEPIGITGKNVLILDYSFSKKVLFVLVLSKRILVPPGRDPGVWVYNLKKSAMYSFTSASFVISRGSSGFP